MMLAIVTPTYNRSEHLERLYNSLALQTSMNFTWYVVDDGSTDSTWEWLKEVSNASTFPVRIMRKENGGKHTAVNAALSTVTEQLTMIVDSDDQLPSHAVATIAATFEAIGDLSGLCGVSFLRAMTNGIPSHPFPADWLRGTYADVRQNRRVAGDKAEVFLTEVLRRYPFPEFPDERFYHEDGVWMRMSRDYEMVHVNTVVYEGTYLSDGLTTSGRIVKMSSPRGMADRSRVFIAYPGPLRRDIRLKHAVLWDVYAMAYMVRATELWRAMPNRLLCSIVLPAAYIINRVWGLSLERRSTRAST